LCPVTKSNISQSGQKITQETALTWKNQKTPTLYKDGSTLCQVFKGLELLRPHGLDSLPVDSLVASLYYFNDSSIKSLQDLRRRNQ
jgi:hypothetical protein